MAQSLFLEGIRTHFVTTNYDFVIETIIDNVLDPQRRFSLFLYTYRGLTPSRVVNQPNRTAVHEHWLAWHLLKINGGYRDTSR